MIKKTKFGFTLIELLVVISIIGLLSTMATVALSNARKKSRMTKRLADMTAIRTAIELYADNNDGEYFSTNGHLVCLGIPSTEECWGGGHGNDALNSALAPYLANIPKDPLYGQRDYGTYLYRSRGQCHYCNGASGFIYGSYSIVFAPEVYPADDEDCGGWSWGSWEGGLGGIPHCLPGGYCRHCGYLAN